LGWVLNWEDHRDHMRFIDDNDPPYTAEVKRSIRVYGHEPAPRWHWKFELTGIDDAPRNGRRRGFRLRMRHFYVPEEWDFRFPAPPGGFFRSFE
jgi:hypothetical protein